MLRAAETPEWLSVVQTFAPYLVVVVTGVVAIITTRLQRLGSRENAIIDQLQEDRTDDRRRLSRLERNDRITQDYVGVLRQHIADGKPPPPPPYPDYPND